MLGYALVDRKEVERGPGGVAGVHLAGLKDARCRLAEGVDIHRWYRRLRLVQDKPPLRLGVRDHGKGLVAAR